MSSIGCFHPYYAEYHPREEHSRAVDPHLRLAHGVSTRGLEIPKKIRSGAHRPFQGHAHASCRLVNFKEIRKKDLLHLRGGNRVPKPLGSNAPAGWLRWTILQVGFNPLRVMSFFRMMWMLGIHIENSFKTTPHQF